MKEKKEIGGEGEDRLGKGQRKEKNKGGKRGKI